MLRMRVWSLVGELRSRMPKGVAKERERKKERKREKDRERQGKRETEERERERKKVLSAQSSSALPSLHWTKASLAPSFLQRRRGSPTTPESLRQPFSAPFQNQKLPYSKTALGDSLGVHFGVWEFLVGDPWLPWRLPLRLQENPSSEGAPQHTPHPCSNSWEWGRAPQDSSQQRETSVSEVPQEAYLDSIHSITGIFQENSACYPKPSAFPFKFKSSPPGLVEQAEVCGAG